MNGSTSRTAVGLSPFVPRLLPRWAPAGGDHLEVPGSLVFADISGFTALSERLAEQGKAGAEELTAVLTATFTELLGVATQFGGDLLSFGGDALLLFFQGDRHAARATRAAAGMREALRARGPVRTGNGQVRLKISMGVHSGDVTIVIGGEQQRELFVIGPAATTVTDMESTADAGEILLSPQTAAQLPPACLGDSKGGGILLRRMPAVGETPSEPPELDGVDLGPYVPGEVRRLVEAGVDEPEHRYVAVAFVHFGGVDALLACEGPERTAQVIHELVVAAERATSEMAVCLLASDIAGDGAKLILTAGAPSSVEDGEARLLLAARAIANCPTPLHLRIGVHAGHVFAGTVGAPWRRVYTVMGDAVNLSARLMGKATHGQVIASKALVHASNSSFEVQALEPFMVKGKSQPQEAYVVGSQLEGKRSDGEIAGAFVGRTDEMQRLQLLLQRPLNGAGGAITIVGEAGIGKSRLLDEALRTVDGVRFIRIICDPFQRDRAYFVARLALRVVLGIPIDAEPAEAGRQLLDIITEADPELLPWAPLVATTIAAVVPSTREVDDIDPSMRQQLVREVVDRLLKRRLTEPTAFVFEDAGRMDDASAALFARLAQSAAVRPWLVCTTTRGEATGLRPELGYDAETVELHPLDPVEQAQLALQATDHGALSDHDLQELIARAAGNPLFLIELSRAWLSAETGEEVPTSLEALVAARIDSLDPADRRVLRYASVLGSRFPRRLLDLSMNDVLSIERGVWRRLDEFLAVQGGDLQFRQDLVREVAYDGLPFRLRRELHRRVAEAVAGSSVLISDSLMALHYDRAGEHEQAWRHGRAAGARARASYANAEAAAQYERALHHGVLAGVPDDEVIEVAEAMGDVSQLAGQFDRATRGYRLARSRCHADDPRVVRLLRKEGLVRDRTGRYPAAVRWYRKGIRTADPDPRPEVQAELSDVIVYLAGTLYRQGRLEACIRWSTRALDHAERTGNRRAEAHACYLLDNSYTDMGRPDGKAYRHRALPIFEELNDFVGQGYVYNNLAGSAMAEGRWRESVDYLQRSRQAQLRAGDVVGTANADFNLGEIGSEQGRFAEAEERLREARRVWRAAGFAIGIAYVTSSLGRLYGRLGRTDEGVALLQDAEEQFTQLGLDSSRREATARRADILLLAGRVDECAAVVAEELPGAPSGDPATAILLRLRGLVFAWRGDATAALDDLVRSIDAATQAGSDYEVAVSSAELARLPGVPAAQAAEAAATSARIADQLDVLLPAVMPQVPWAQQPVG